MKTIVIACQTLTKEVRLVVDKVQFPYPIIWIESGLHTFPDKLREAVRKEIDRIDNVDHILLVFGYCGNSLLGLVSNNARLIFPRVDDCISLMLGGNEQKKLLNERAMAYFLTEGWLRYENNIWKDFLRTAEKYGHERARQVMKIMLKHYQNLNIIDTGAYDLEKFYQETKKIAEELELAHEVVKGSLRILYKALREEWDEEFAIIEPGRAVSLYDCSMASRAGPGPLNPSFMV